MSLWFSHLPQREEYFRLKYDSERYNSPLRIHTKKNHTLIGLGPPTLSKSDVKLHYNVFFTCEAVTVDSINHPMGPVFLNQREYLLFPVVTFRHTNYDDTYKFVSAQVFFNEPDFGCCCVPENYRQFRKQQVQKQAEQIELTCREAFRGDTIKISPDELIDMWIRRYRIQHEIEKEQQVKSCCIVL